MRVADLSFIHVRRQGGWRRPQGHGLSWAWGWEVGLQGLIRAEKYHRPVLNLAVLYIPGFGVEVCPHHAGF